MSTLYSLLIGIDHYFEYQLEGGLYYPKLGGCVRDINKVYNFLSARVGVEPQNVIKLTASLGANAPLSQKISGRPTITSSPPSISSPSAPNRATKSTFNIPVTAGAPRRCSLS